MNGLDGAVSTVWMCDAGTVADAATLHVGIGYFSFGDKALFRTGFQGNELKAKFDQAWILRLYF